MASLIRDLRQSYERDFFPKADPRTKDWLLLNSSPVYVWMLTASYLLFIWVGPSVMRNRKPFSLQWFMVVYNLGLVALSAYMFVEVLLSTIDVGYNYIGCAPYNEESRSNPKEMRVARVLWWYFFSKAIELMDTVLMILRKRHRQITFLHVFHHASMLNIWWWVMTFIPGGLSFFGCALNCLVHVVMYLYYGLSVVPSLKNKLWWKRYITQFQLSQFCVTLTHSIYSLLTPCDFPDWGQYLLSGYMILMLILFTNFYIKSYLQSRQRRAPKTAAVKSEGVANGITCNGASNGLKKRN